MRQLSVGPQKFILAGPLFASVLANLVVFLGRLPQNTAWEIIVRKYVKSRSDHQNNALFLAYGILSKETGYDKDELHEAFCKKYFGSVDVDVFGEVKTKPLRTTTRNERGERDVLPWDQFCDFYATVQRVAAESGIHIPEPDPMKRTR